MAPIIVIFCACRYYVCADKDSESIYQDVKQPGTTGELSFQEESSSGSKNS